MLLFWSSTEGKSPTQQRPTVRHRLRHKPHKQYYSLTDPLRARWGINLWQFLPTLWPVLCSFNSAITVWLYVVLDLAPFSLLGSISVHDLGFELGPFWAHVPAIEVGGVWFPTQGRYTWPSCEGLRERSSRARRCSRVSWDISCGRHRSSSYLVLSLASILSHITALIFTLLLYRQTFD